MRKILMLMCLFFSVSSFAESVVLLKPAIDRFDMASIRRGATFVAANCLSCHTMLYMRGNKLAQEAGVTYERMPVDVKEWPNGITPPDLSLVADVRGLDWLYTYLHSFYQDPNRPTGMNNLLVHNTGMANILLAYQGEQVLLQPQGVLKLTKQGSLTPLAFDATMGDVVNFLGYAAEPYRIKQQKIGIAVIIFLGIFVLLAYFLNKEYWKDVRQHSQGSTHE